jgi:serine/threonine protein kinase
MGDPRGAGRADSAGQAIPVNGTVLVGRYRLGEQFDRGRLGELWHCVDEATGQTVVAKILRPELREKQGFAGRLQLGWAREMAFIDNPGIVHLHDHGDDRQAGLFIVMDYVQGRSLPQILQEERRLSPARALHLVAGIADALHAIHERGMVHRELRPGKVLIRPDATVVLSLFGLSHCVAGTQPWAIGEPGYLSPEQLSDGRVTYRSDIYALGVMLYESVAGRPAFAGNSPLEIALRSVRERPAPLPVDVPAEVGALVNRAIEKDPASRWPSAAAFAHALSTVG